MTIFLSIVKVALLVVTIGLLVYMSKVSFKEAGNVMSPLDHIIIIAGQAVVTIAIWWMIHDGFDTIAIIFAVLSTVLVMFYFKIYVGARIRLSADTFWLLITYIAIFFNQAWQTMSLLSEKNGKIFACVIGGIIIIFGLLDLIYRSERKWQEFRGKVCEQGLKWAFFITGIPVVLYIVFRTCNAIIYVRR